MKRIDFNIATPYFVNGEFKWYFEPDFQRQIKNEQAFNLPKLENIACFVVKGDSSEDYVLIDNKQNVIASYPYNHNGFENMETKIKMIKIAKHFDEHEKANV